MTELLLWELLALARCASKDNSVQPFEKVFLVSFSSKIRHKCVAVLDKKSDGEVRIKAGITLREAIIAATNGSPMKMSDRYTIERYGNDDDDYQWLMENRKKRTMNDQDH